jgi:hypothetical protein
MVFASKHVVTCQRHCVNAMSKLSLKDHQAPVAKAHLAGSEVELPHATESIIVQIA